MATIGPVKKVFSIPEPVEAPAFTKPVPQPVEAPAEPERELVPVRTAPKRALLPAYYNVKVGDKVHIVQNPVTKRWYRWA